MRIMRFAIAALCVLLLCAFDPPGELTHKTARLPNAALLTGYDGDLSVVTPRSVSTLEPQEGTGTRPTLSRSGALIGTTRIKKRVGRGIPTVVAAVYSVADKKWTEFPPEIQHGGTAAISPDGSKLALAYWEPDAKGIFLHVIDVATRADRRIDLGLAYRYGTNWISWSPDGRRLALAASKKLIEIVDLKTGKVSTIAQGEMPAWSPSGEWIAYLEDSDHLNNPNRALLIRPDGSEKKILVTLGRSLFGVDRIFHAPPVWSPDSTQLILNELYDSQADTYEIHLLTLSTMRMKRIARDVPPVYGWVESR